MSTLFTPSLSVSVAEFPYNTTIPLRSNLKYRRSNAVTDLYPWIGLWSSPVNRDSCAGSGVGTGERDRHCKLVHGHYRPGRQPRPGGVEGPLFTKSKLSLQYFCVRVSVTVP